MGGNAANASPAATRAILLAADAELVLGSVRGERTVPAAEFWPSYRKTALAQDELILRIRFPLAGQRRVRFRKVGTRRAQAISKVVMALAWQAGAEGVARGAARAGLGGRHAGACAAHRGRPGRRLADCRDSRSCGGPALRDEIQPIDDVRTADYRREVAAASCIGSSATKEGW